MALRRIVTLLDEKLVEQVEEYANEMHLNRTAAITVLLSQALKADKGMNTLNEIMAAYKEEQSKQNGNVKGKLGPKA